MGSEEELKRRYDLFTRLSPARGRELAPHLVGAAEAGYVSLRLLRSKLPAAQVARAIRLGVDVPASEFESSVNRLLEVGPKHVHPSGVEKGVTFWRSVWDAIRLSGRS